MGEGGEWGGGKRERNGARGKGGEDKRSVGESMKGEWGKGNERGWGKRVV